MKDYIVSVSFCSLVGFFIVPLGALGKGSSFFHSGASSMEELAVLACVGAVVGGLAGYRTARDGANVDVGPWNNRH